MGTKRIEILETLKEELRRPRGIVVLLFLVFIAGVWISPRIKVGSDRNDLSIVELPMPAVTVTPTSSPTPTVGDVLIERPDLYNMTPTPAASVNEDYNYSAQSDALAQSVVTGVFGLVGNIIGLQMGIVNHTLGNVREDIELKNEIRQTRHEIMKQWLEKVKNNQ